MPNLIPFQFDACEVRVYMDETNQPWWIAQDVCRVLGLNDTAKAVRRLKKDEKGKTLIPTPGGPQEVLTTNEPGLYRLIFRSDKPEALRFQEWVFHEVLPQIRKTGAYSPDIHEVKNPVIKMLIDMAVQLDKTEALAEAAKAEADAAKGMAQLALEGQEWLTIRQYVLVYQLERQFPESDQKAYGVWLTKYCHQENIPVYALAPADRRWDQENTYHSGTMKKTLRAWLLRRSGQGNLLTMPPAEG